jgi:hypothetical protein
MSETEKFTPFPRLPKELRLAVWELALQETELPTTDINPWGCFHRPPPMAGACHESRDLVLKTTQIVVVDDLRGEPAAGSDAGGGGGGGVTAAAAAAAAAADDHVTGDQLNRRLPRIPIWFAPRTLAFAPYVLCALRWRSRRARSP